MAQPKVNEGPAFARSVIRGKGVTTLTPNGIVHEQGQSPDEWYRGRFDTLTKTWLPNPPWNGNRTGE